MWKLLSLLLVAACAPGLYDQPIPMLLPDGKRGFGMTGYVQFTTDESKARADVVNAFEAVCGGAVTLRLLDLQRADSLVGVPHIHYDAVAECRDQTPPPR